MALHSVFLICLVFAFLLYRYVIYPAFVSPLSKVPTSHPTASILSIWLWWKEYRGTLALGIFDAHQRKGPIVRIAPNEVHVASLEGLRVAFNSGNFERSDWFLQFRNYDGTPNLVTMLNSKQHTTRRRIVSHIFSKSYLFSSVDFQNLSQDVLFERLMPIFDEASQTNQGVDVYELTHAASAEFMSAYQVGTENCLDITRKGREHERRAYFENGKAKTLELKGQNKAVKYLEDQTMEICRKAEDFLSSRSSMNKEKTDQSDSGSTSTYPVQYAQLRNSIPEKEGSKSLQDTLNLIASELVDNLEAARVGMGVTLTYVLHELTLRPDMQSALRKEVMTLDPPLSFPPGQNKISTSLLRKLDGLSLLDAVITETLRVRIPFLFPFRRVVPKGGAVINDYFLPAGVIIGSSTYSLHMNQDIYPKPNEWNPKRWLDQKGVVGPQASRKSNDKELETGKSDDDPRRWFWAFGSGGRMCIGNHFALLVMKLVIAAIYTNYTTYIIDDEGIEQSISMIAVPGGDKLILGFNRISEV